MKPFLLLTVLSLALAACGKEDKRPAAPAVAASSPDAAPSAAALPPPPTASAAESVASGATAAPMGSAAEQQREARAARSMRARGSRAGTTGSPAASGSTTYVVVKGDTLAGIARNRGVTAAELARWNGVRDPRQLRIGQKLRLTAP